MLMSWQVPMVLMRKLGSTRFCVNVLCGCHKAGQRSGHELIAAATSGGCARKEKEVVADENEPMWQPTTLDLDELYDNINNNSLCSYQN